MKKALLLHGWEGNSTSHWLPWLGEELKKQEYEVIIPDLPETDFPVLENQAEHIKNLFPLLEKGARGNLGKGDIIIAHSLGCQVALKYIEEEKITGVSVVFVAPSYNYLADELGDDRLGDAFTCMSNAFNVLNNFRQLNKLKNTYTVMLSDDDPYINSFSAQAYYGQLDSASFVDCVGKGHFNTSAGVVELPEVMKYL